MANISDILNQLGGKNAMDTLKKKAENGELSDILKSADSLKVQQMLKSLGLQDNIKQSDIDAVLDKVKENPDLIQNLKNKL